MTAIKLDFKEDGDYVVFGVGDRDSYREYINRTAMGKRDPVDGPTCEVHSTCLRDLTAMGIALCVLTTFHIYLGVAADVRIAVRSEVRDPSAKIREVIARLEAWPDKPSGLYYEKQ